MAIEIKTPLTIQNAKGFFVIPISQKQVIEIFEGYGMCDYCATVESAEGFLIPVLGSKWYCTKCYEDFERTSTNYPEDQPYEQTVLKRMEHRIAMWEQSMIDELSNLGVI